MAAEKKTFSSLMVKGEKRYVRDDDAHNKIESLETDIDLKQDRLTPGNNIIIEEDSEGQLIIDTKKFSSDYNDLSNLPSINGVTLQGDLSSRDLSIATKISELENDSDFIDSDDIISGYGIDIVQDSEGKIVISNTQTSAEWGNIQGTIEDQIDLVNYVLGQINSIDLIDCGTSTLNV